jgi:hypothetical protein
MYEGAKIFGAHQGQYLAADGFVKAYAGTAEITTKIRWMGYGRVALGGVVGSTVGGLIFYGISEGIRINNDPEILKRFNENQKKNPYRGFVIGR